MKKFTLISVAIASVFSFTALVNNPVSAQKPIPDEVLAVAKKSCLKCHTEPGKTMALSKVNLSKWDSYEAEKQATKAAAMCNMVTKGKMPPKKFKAENPDFVLTTDEIKIICDWSSSIQVAKK
ncbi:MAG: heme-binding domain-containing protein [Methanococcaceae archaeon]